jgi:hypothetical protein
MSTAIKARASELVDFITGKPVPDKPEEHVRQNWERTLVFEYGYQKGDIEPEFSIKSGSARQRVDTSLSFAKVSPTHKRTFSSLWKLSEPRFHLKTKKKAWLNWSPTFPLALMLSLRCGPTVSSGFATPSGRQADCASRCPL